MEQQKLTTPFNRRKIRQSQGIYPTWMGKTRNPVVEPVYPEEMFNDNVSVISMDTVITNAETLSTDNYDNYNAGVLYAKNLELKEKNGELKNEIVKLKNKIYYTTKEIEEKSRVKHYKKALNDLTTEYDKIKQENDVLKKTLIEKSTINDNNDNIINSIFKLMECKLPIPNPKCGKYVIDKLHQVDGCLIAGISGIVSMVGLKCKNEDIVLVDITNCYSKRVIHVFSNSEKFMIVNLPTSEYRKNNPSYPLEQVSDAKSFGMIRELYKAITNN